MKDLSWLKTEYIAHRGLYNKDQSIPENSILSFNEALKHNYAIECDINVLKDGTVVVYHDKDLVRACNINKLLGEVTYDDIKTLTLFETNEKIPLLTDLLTLVAGRKPLLIELKPHGDWELLVKNTVSILKAYKYPYALFSFNPKIVMWLKKNEPNIIRGQITSYFKEDKNMKSLTKYLMRSLFFAKFNKPDFISYHIKDLPNKYLDKAYKKGLVCISYTARTDLELNFVREKYHNSVFEYFKPAIK